MGRRRIGLLGLPLLALALTGCSLFDWQPPGGSRGDVERTDAVLRAILVAEEHVTEPMYHAFACADGDPCPATGELVEALDAEVPALQAALDAHPGDCLADAAQGELRAYAELRTFAGSDGDAALAASDAFNRLKYEAFVATLDCTFLPGPGDAAERELRAAAAAGWQELNEAYACEGDGCMAEHGRTTATAARAAVAAAEPRIGEAPEGCQRDYLAASVDLMRGYAEIGDLLAAGDLDGATVRTVELDEQDNHTMRAFVICLDNTSSGGGWAPAPTGAA